MTTRTIESKRELENLLSALTEAGCDRVAILRPGAYDGVEFVVCTDPDGDWYSLNDPSGENYSFGRNYVVTEAVVLGPTTVLYPDNFDIPEDVDRY